MRVYATHFHDPDWGEIVSWHGSDRAAKLELARLKRERRELERKQIGSEKVVRHDVPANKEAMLEWLNNIATRNNG